jgi:peptide methionine sulfoxide reductase MsrA
MGNGFRSHSPRQYGSAIFYFNDKQKEEAEKNVQTLKAYANGNCVYVDVEIVRPFYRAEEYHQDYLAKAGRKPRASGGKGLFF